MTGTVFSIQRFCLDDGPGIRTSVFLKGCPLDCAWCHNPESKNSNTQILFDKEKCVLCSECEKSCAHNCHSFTENGHIFEREKCIKCGKCAEFCIYGAISLCGKIMTAGEIIEEIKKDVSYYRENGGMTLSGGEPFYQPDFAIELLRSAKENGIGTAVETCGFVKTDILEKALEYTDLFLFDYKLSESTEHEKYTGVPNGIILKNLEYICKRGAKVVLRCPLIPNVNTFESHYDSIVEIAEKNNISEINLMPYHPLGISKAKKLGKEPKYNKTDFMDKNDSLSAYEYIKKRTSITVELK